VKTNFSGRLRGKGGVALKASEDLKRAAAEEIGLLPQLEEEGWGNLTSRDAGNLVREMVQRGAQEITDENQRLGFEVAQEMGLTDAFLSGRGWRDFTPKQMFAFAERIAQKRQGDP
jgi:hypothetical protein